MAGSIRYKDRWSRIKSVYLRWGLIKTLKYIGSEGLKRASAGHQYRTFSKRYPQNVVFIAALPKSGSSWIRNMFASLDGFSAYSPSRWNTSIPDKWDGDRSWNLYPGVFDEFEGKLAVIRGHTRGFKKNIEILNQAGLKYLVTVRDPRDQLISEYWYSRNFPAHWQGELARRLSLSDFISHKIESGEFDEQSLGWLKSWVLHLEDGFATLIRYEDILHDPVKIFGDALTFLGFKWDETGIRKIVDLHSFKKVTGRTRGDTDNSKFNRKGISGEWRSVFTQDQLHKISDDGYTLIEEMGYATELDGA